MLLEPPNLDDRTFDDLVASARQRIASSCPEWSDLSAGDPGMVLVELFAHLTEVMIYRLNRLPDRAFIEFLRLIGLRLEPPAAASARLRFALPAARDEPVQIPRGAQVAVARPGSGGEPVVFSTDADAAIPAGQTEAFVSAHHGERVEAEDAGEGTGLPGQVVTARRPPLVAPTGEGTDLLVAIEATADELSGRTDAVQHDGRGYRVWREVHSFAHAHPGDPVYVVDRVTGVITFAPAVRMTAAAPGADRPEGAGRALESEPRALAGIPPAGRRILLWYRRGGGPEGNLAANTPLALRRAIPGVTLAVSNPEPATGGRAAESLENALVRGPQELHSLERAVTARDFELLALASSGAVARAKAFTRAAVWTYAPRGTVEVLLVPALPDAAGRADAQALAAQETADARDRVQAALDERRPLGTSVRVGWVRYKSARVRARVVVHRGEDAAAVRGRVLDRLYQTITPLPTVAGPGWPFGQSLRASHVYDIILKEPGVSFVDRVRLLVDEAPDERVTALAADPFQPRTWYAAAGEVLFRSLDDGDGWEPARRLPGAQIDIVRPHPGRPGLLAVATSPAGGAAGGSRVYVSDDCGESWSDAARFAFVVADLAWTTRGGVPVLLMATEAGLYELHIAPRATPVQVLVDPDRIDLGFHAIATTRVVHGVVNVAVAARGSAGVYLSQDGGAAKTFKKIGPDNRDVRILEVQYDGSRAFLWAGMAAVGSADGDGCSAYELRGLGEAPPEGWRHFSKGWKGGSCRGIAFQGPRVLAATHRTGVVWLSAATGDATWQAPDVNCNLPLRDRARLSPVDAVASNPERFVPPPTAPEGVAPTATTAGVATTVAAKPAAAPAPAAPAAKTVATPSPDPAAKVVAAQPTPTSPAPPTEPPKTPRLRAEPAGRILLAGGVKGVYLSRDGGVSYVSCSLNVFTERVTLPQTWLFTSGQHEVEVSEGEAD